MTADLEKEKVTIEATEPIVATIPVCDFIQCNVCQRCMLCENTRKLPGYSYSYSPWVCDECKKAIAFIKDKLKYDPLEPTLD